MARKITEIKSQMTQVFIDHPWVSVNYELQPGRTFDDQFSSVSIESILFDVIAFCVYSLEKLFDIHKQETDTAIAELKPHTGNWYRNLAKNFQYGYSLITDSHLYDNTGISEEAIEVSKIVKYAAVGESVTESRLILKVATQINGKLQPINPAQYTAFKAYINEGKDAGVNVSIINYLPDRLYLSIDIYYNPLVLDASGSSIVDGGKPVERALEQYMENLPFNGQLVLAHLVDKLQAVHGVDIPNLTNAQTSWIDGLTNDYGPISPINVQRIPESGYFEIVDFLNIKYLPNVEANI